MDETLTSKRLSPGGAADLLTGTLFLALVASTSPEEGPLYPEARPRSLTFLSRRVY